MIEVGSRVRSKSGDFQGRVLGRHGSSGVGGASEYRSLPDNLNLSIYSVLNDDGEIRQYTREGIELVSD